MIDIADHPAPAHDPANVAIVLVEDDDPDDFDIDVDDEVVAARTEFSWTVKFTVSGTWVADGFDLGHERAMTMLRTDLVYAHEHEVSAQVLEAPPPAAIQAMQGELEVLPPARWIGGAFLVGEAMSHDDDGQARYAYYFRRGDQHFHGADLTIAEFEAKHGKGR